jgi:hypothetical protein
MPKHKFRVSFCQTPSHNCEKILLASCLSVLLSVRIEQLGYNLKDIYEIWYLNISRESVEKLQVWLRSDKNNRNFTR